MTWRAALIALLFVAGCGGGSEQQAPPSPPPADAIACPPQTARTIVLLIAGQSNAANIAQQKFTSDYGARVANFYQGFCFVAQSPLRGPDGTLGESWTLLGNKLIAAGVADNVVLVAYAIGGTEIARWQAGADLNVALLANAAAAQGRYHFTHVLWVQGEQDFAIGTSGADYTAMFNSLVDSLRAQNIDAPIYASVATWCARQSQWTPDNPIALAQRALPDPARSVRAGVDADTLIGIADRWDTCHFAATGQQKFSDAWLAILRP